MRRLLRRDNDTQVRQCRVPKGARDHVRHPGRLNGLHVPHVLLHGWVYHAALILGLCSWRIHLRPGGHNLHGTVSGALLSRKVWPLRREPLDFPLCSAGGRPDALRWKLHYLPEQVNNGVSYLGVMTLPGHLFITTITNWTQLEKAAKALHYYYITIIRLYK